MFRESGIRGRVFWNAASVVKTPRVLEIVAHGERRGEAPGSEKDQLQVRV